MKLAHVVTAGLVALAIASPAAAQDTTHGKIVSAVAKTNAGKSNKGKSSGLKAEARISRDSARTIALARVAAGSKVRKSRLERENGVAVYTFDIRVPNQTGVEHILVNAADGSVVSQTHVAPKPEKAEAKKEKGEKKKSDKND